MFSEPLPSVFLCLNLTRAYVLRRDTTATLNLKKKNVLTPHIIDKTYFANFTFHSDV